MTFQSEETLRQDSTEKTVLVVDDESDITLFIQKSLEAIGFTVVVAHSADQAMQEILHHRIDLILSDVKMPGGSGFDLAALTRLTEHGTPIILMSGHVEEHEMQEKGFDDGILHCLQKPFSLTTLKEKIENALEDDDFSPPRHDEDFELYEDEIID